MGGFILKTHNVLEQNIVRFQNKTAHSALCNFFRFLGEDAVFN